jgi:glycosyltransferase involved in cell wall biosynthesis
MNVGGGDNREGKPRVLWLHTQPEHYHNCMMDDLQQLGDIDYVAAFSHKGDGSYAELPTPKIARTVILRRFPGKPDRFPGFWEPWNVDWRADLADVRYDLAIVSGYGLKTHREMIQDCRRRGIPVAMFSDSNIRSQMGTSWRERLKRLAKKRLLKGLIRDSDVLLTANRLGVEYWKYYGAPGAKLVVCPYYADYERVARAGRTQRGEVLGRFGLKAEDRLLFTAARLVPAKGLDLAINAFRASRLPHQGYRYLIAGAGPLEAELKRKAGDALGTSIRFIGFQQPSDNLALMHHADVFILPSVYEPHGIVVQESLAAGTPVLASDVVGAAYDLVEAGVNGQIFRSGDSSDLQAKLASMLADAPRLAQMRTAARTGFERWFAEYSPIKVVDRVVHELLEAKRRSKSGGRDE